MTAQPNGEEKSRSRHESDVSWDNLSLLFTLFIFNTDYKKFKKITTYFLIKFQGKQERKLKKNHVKAKAVKYNYAF